MTAKRSFALIEREDKRVVLEQMREPKDTETLIDIIKADSWLDAVDIVKVMAFEYGMYHKPGYGFYRE